MPSRTSGFEYDKIVYLDSAVPASFQLNKKMVELREPKWHEQVEIKYFLKGSAEIGCNSNVFIAKEGDIVIVNPCELHNIKSIGDGVAAEYNLIMLDSSFIIGADMGAQRTAIQKYLDPFIEGRLKFQNHITGDEICETILKNLFKELGNMVDAYDLMVKGLLMMFFAHLFRNHVAWIIDEDKINGIRRYSDRLEPALLYITQNYHENFAIGTLAQTCSMSLYHFCRVFKTVTGTTPVNYINEYRINKAVLLLTTTSMNISEIALSVGFRDECYFSRCFKRIKGITPSSLRAK